MRGAPDFVREAAKALELHFAGRTQDFTRVPLDYTGLPPFHARVYEASRKVKSGTTVSYGELATRAGSPGASRAVGQAMARNPFFVVVPCHRVAASAKKLGGFSAPGGAVTKRRMLEIEGAFLEPPPYDVARAVRELRARPIPRSRKSSTRRVSGASRSRRSTRSSKRSVARSSTSSSADARPPRFIGSTPRSFRITARRPSTSRRSPTRNYAPQASRPRSSRRSAISRRSRSPPSRRCAR